MFNKPKRKSRLQTEIDKLVLALNDHATGSEEYGQIVERLSKLHKIQQDTTPTRSVSPDTALTVGANLLGILMIVRHEHLHVITSKALNFVRL